MCINENGNSARLRVTQAFIALSGIPENQPDPLRIISVMKLGASEIRMFGGPAGLSGEPPLLWMELFNHHAQQSQDSCAFREIDEALAAFDHMKSQVKT